MKPHRTSSSRSLRDEPVPPAVSVRCRTIELPAIHDGVVIGRDAAFDCRTLTQALRLLSRDRFESLALKDGVVGAILVRQAVLRKLGWKLVRRIVLRNVRPLMTRTEIMALEFRIELTLTEGA